MMFLDSKVTCCNVLQIIKVHHWQCVHCEKVLKAKSYRHRCKVFKNDNCEGCNKIAIKNPLLYKHTYQTYCDSGNYKDDVMSIIKGYRSELDICLNSFGREVAMVKKPTKKRVEKWKILDGPACCIDCNFLILTGNKHQNSLPMGRI